MAYRAPRARYGLERLAQKTPGGNAVLTELGIEEDGRAKTMASLTGGGAGAELAEGVLQRFSGRLDSAGRLVVLLRGYTRGLGRLRGRRR